ncbi:MAG: hypothetical protein CSA20_07575 [Deltaproteobacteria bacterium]|nr:MAG: hypothetical protein CSB32_00355 [Desulfobacterales bacterium]PIE72489.1 MAG: hypothetical protein CSA20_07575 [Deltaproteobacteria bacterium]
MRLLYWQQCFRAELKKIGYYASPCVGRVLLRKSAGRGFVFDGAVGVLQRKDSLSMGRARKLFEPIGRL